MRLDHFHLEMFRACKQQNNLLHRVRRAVREVSQPIAGSATEVVRVRWLEPRLWSRDRG